MYVYLSVYPTNWWGFDDRKCVCLLQFHQHLALGLHIVQCLLFFFLNDNMDVLIETFFYLHHTTAGTTQFLSQWVRVVYWVSQKVHLDFSIRCNGKSKRTFLSSDNIVVLKLPLFKSARYWVQKGWTVWMKNCLPRTEPQSHGCTPRSANSIGISGSGMVTGESSIQAGIQRASENYSSATWAWRVLASMCTIQRREKLEHWGICNSFVTISVEWEKGVSLDEYSGFRSRGSC